MLILSRKKDESIIIDEKIHISIVDIKGDQVKIGINAPKDVKIYRQEIYEAIQRENREAAETAASVIPKLDELLK